MICPVLSAVPIDQIRGDDELDTKLLRQMSDQAVTYVQSFAWCLELHDRYFCDGYGGIVALFLFRVSIGGYRTPEWVWIIVGDLPSVYLEFEGFPTPQAALERYLEGVEEWLAATAAERESGEIIPIDVPPDPELIEMLRVRAKTLRESILPHIRNN
jgi:hypothetical protein